MKMGVYLKLGNVDFSGYIFENSYSVRSVPVYDEAAEYVNIYGEKMRTRTGRYIEIDAVLCDLPDEKAAVLEEIAEAGQTDITYSFPEEKSCRAAAESVKLSLDRVYRGEKFWRAEAVFRGFVPDSL